MATTGFYTHVQGPTSHESARSNRWGLGEDVFNYATGSGALIPPHTPGHHLPCSALTTLLSALYGQSVEFQLRLKSYGILLPVVWYVADPSGRAV
jgi:hypothetical protein